jgi:hypothetical protein
MLIAVSHLTRMREGFICVAGHEVKRRVPDGTLQITGSLKRPVLQYQQIDADMLKVFQLGSVVNLGNITPYPQPPHVEDVVFSPRQCKRESVLSPDDFWHVLESTAHSSLTDIFGDAFKRHNWTLYVDPTEPLSVPPNQVSAIGAKCSLGQWILDASSVDVTVISSTKLRLAVSRINVSLPLTDVRLYRQPFWELDEEALYELLQALQGAKQEKQKIVLSMGLTRAFPSERLSRPVCWLQVNNIHVRSNLLWKGSLRSQAEFTPVALSEL